MSSSTGSTHVTTVTTPKLVNAERGALYPVGVLLIAGFRLAILAEKAACPRDIAMLISRRKGTPNHVEGIWLSADDLGVSQYLKNLAC
jgi:hypothetical protein